jgi:multicomponent Na+:H+ antiporter subunit G
MIYVTGWFLITVGVVFFLMGTLALMRFPDLFTRLHALTKADNLGLGMIAAGLALHSGSFTAGMKLLLIWLLIMLASASVSHLIARTARQIKHSKEYRA